MIKHLPVAPASNCALGVPPKCTSVEQKGKNSSVVFSVNHIPSIVLSALGYFMSSLPRSYDVGMNTLMIGEGTKNQRGLILCLNRAASELGWGQRWHLSPGRQAPEAVLSALALCCAASYHSAACLAGCQKL